MSELTHPFNQSEEKCFISSSLGTVKHHDGNDASIPERNDLYIESSLKL